MRLGKDSNAQTWTTNRDFQVEAEDVARERRLKEHSTGLGNPSLAKVARQLARQLRANDRRIAVFNDEQAKRLQGIKDGPLLAAKRVSDLLGKEVTPSLASPEELEEYGVRAWTVNVRVVASDGIIEKATFNCVRLAVS